MMRNTIQRNLVFQAVNEMHDHPTADEVYDYVSQKYPTISKGTVYRNLNLLASMGSITKIEVPFGADRFDHTCKPHYHFHCTRCGKVYDVFGGKNADLSAILDLPTGFEVTSHDIIFKGLCPDCKDSK